MKIILSRKGFDSENGGIPSPIMPCGRLLSLPIPVNEKQQARGEQGIPYGDLRFDGLPFNTIIHQSSNGRFDMSQPSHLDPDLDRERYSRQRGWRQVFGQTGSAQGHLQKQVVKEKDIFLFYGWFNKDGQDCHVIFGWLQIGEIVDVNTDQNKIPAWLNYHPHIVNARLSNYRKNNTIYIAQERLALSGLTKAGAGVFPHFMDKLRLTAPWESRRSHWLLPKWFFPFKEPSRPPLTYHKNPKRWTLNDDGVLLSTAYRGQEFVLDTEYYPEAMDWLKSLFESVN